MEWEENLATIIDDPNLYTQMVELIGDIVGWSLDEARVDSETKKDILDNLDL